MRTIKNDGLVIKMWTDKIEDGAMEQVEHLAQLPFAFHHIAIMPDVHQGFGMPIGGVLAAKDAIIPNAVGSDIGCGMCAVKTSLTGIDTDTLKKIMGEIRKVVPVGFSHQKEKQDENLMPEFDVFADYVKFGIVEQEYKNALTQLGTLGGGNHFIEIQKGSDNHIWIMIHSGSRNLGLKVANYYNKLAVELNVKWYSKIPKEWDLAFLPVNTKEAQNYIKEMNYCIAFAFANRELMMNRIKGIFIEKVKEISFKPMINIAHNYARLENHFGQNVWVHRKGATSAQKDEIGIIPGSQGTNSYIIKGLGSPESFMSCSHGAGRVMGRKQAIKSLDFNTEVARLENAGVIHSLRTKKDLDEAPSCYKDIDEVINNEKDLITPIIKLMPLAVIKG